MRTSNDWKRKMAQDQKKADSRTPRKLSRRWRFRLTVLLVVAVVIPILYPFYREYCYEDRKESCYGAREYVTTTYQRMVDEELSEGIKAENIDYTDLVKKAFTETYDVSVGEDLTIRDLCKAGGTIQVTIDPLTHLLTISCTAEGHETYQQRD